MSTPVNNYRAQLQEALSHKESTCLRGLLTAPGAPALELNFLTPGYHGEAPLEISPETLRTGAPPELLENDYTPKPFICAALARWGRAYQPGDIFDLMLRNANLDLTREDADGQTAAQYATVFAPATLLAQLIAQTPACLSSRANNLINLAVGYARPAHLQLLLAQGVSARQRSTLTNTDGLHLLLCRHNLLVAELCAQYPTPDVLQPAVRQSSELQALRQEYELLRAGGARLTSAHADYHRAAQTLGYGFFSARDHVRD